MGERCDEPCGGEAILPNSGASLWSLTRLCLSTAFEPEPLDDNFADHEFRVAVGSALDEADLSNNEVEEIDELTQHRYAGLCVPQLPCRHAERHQRAGQEASMCASPHCAIHSCS